MLPMRNPIENLKKSIKRLYHNSPFYKGNSIAQKGAYKAELEKFLLDMQYIADEDVIDELVAEQGIHNTAREYANLNQFYKEYYSFIIREIKKDEFASKDLKALADKTAKEWNRTFKAAIAYLYKKKQRMLYGESYEPDLFEDTTINPSQFSPFQPADPAQVKHFTANSFADRELPWLRKEDLNEEDYFDEGLKGAFFGGTAGAALAMTVGSLAAAFHLHPRIITGISSALGAMIGHFIQKHYFIDFTNYVKLKRYIEYEPEAYELILEMMQRNATKFQQKDPVKYKKILQNLQRLKNNPPVQYRSYLDDEIERDYEDDADLFDVRDREGNMLKKGSSELQSSGYSSRSRRPISNKTYDVKDLGSGDIDSQLDDLISKI